MIIEPVPLGPPSAPRRRLRVLALAVPLLLLGGVVAAGSLGPRPAPSASPPAVAVASPAVTTPDAASPAATAAATPSPKGLPAGVPARIAGLDVLTVGEALELRGTGLLRGVAAIGGYLGVREETVCSGTFCARVGILAESPFTAATEFGEIGPHLHPQLPAGVLLPASADIADTRPPRAGAAAPAAVVVARFDDPRARRCMPAGRHCDQELVVERVAWVDGTSYPRMLTVDPSIAPVPDAEALATAGRAAERGLGSSATPMLTVLVRPGTIPYIDPAMAASLADLDSAPVWYVRGLSLKDEGDVILWVIASEDGSLIRTGALPVIEAAPGDGD